MSRIITASGHGGKDTGAINSKIYEKYLNWDLTMEFGEIMKKNFICEVINIQPSMTNMNVTAKQDLYQTIEIAKRLHKIKPIDLYLSFHTNSSTDKKAHGYESFVYPNAKGKIADTYRNQIHQHIMGFLKGYGITDRGKKYENFAEVRETLMPAILFEDLFISNEREVNLLLDKDFMHKLANEYAYIVSVVLDLKRK